MTGARGARTLRLYATVLSDFAKFRNVPIFNPEIHQEATVSPTSVEVFKQARRLWHERRP